VSHLVRVKLVDGKAVVVNEAVHPGEVEFRKAFDECVEELLCDCPFCKRRVISEEKRCPHCHRLMWGQFTAMLGVGPLVGPIR
jgi:tRNA(Ile2) C34 agmatinyltransferase TiaS